MADEALEDTGPQAPPPPTREELLANAPVVADRTPAVLERTLGQHVDDAAELHHALNVFHLDQVEADDEAMTATGDMFNALESVIKTARDKAEAATVACDGALNHLARVRHDWQDYLVRRSGERSARLHEIVGE